MADEHVHDGHVRLLNRRVGLLVAAAALFVLAGWPGRAVEATTPVRTVGVATLTFDADGPGGEEPLRHRVDALLSSESSEHPDGVVCRIELVHSSFRNLRPVLVLDASMDALLRELVLPLPSSGASFSYREMASGAEVEFEAVDVAGHVELFDYDPGYSGGVALHLLFDVVVENAAGASRVISDAEVVVAPGVGTVTEDGGVWYYDDGADYVDVSGAYMASDCAGDPLPDDDWDDDWDDWDDDDDDETDYWFDDDGEDYWSDDSSCDGGDDWDDDDDYWSDDSSACDGGDDWDSDSSDDWGDSCDTEASVGSRKGSGRSRSRFRTTLPFAALFFWWLWLRFPAGRKRDHSTTMRPISSSSKPSAVPGS